VIRGENKMTRFKIYDRLTLELRDSGVVRDYNIDFDYIANNNSTMRLVDESRGFKGDILAISEGVNLIALGVITAVDNTELKIQFKHMKELFNDDVLNVFRWTNLLGKRFDAVAGLQVLLEYAFINTTDTLRRLPLTIRTFGQNLDAVWTDDRSNQSTSNNIPLVQDNLSIAASGIHQIPLFLCQINNNRTITVTSQRVILSRIGHAENAVNLSGTVETAVTAVTQAENNNSTRLATTEYADRAARAALNITSASIVGGNGTVRRQGNFVILNGTGTSRHSARGL
jgi:hypothetical protein